MILNCSSYVAPLSRHDTSCYPGPWKLLMTGCVILLHLQHLYDHWVNRIYGFAWMLSPTWTPCTWCTWSPLCLSASLLLSSTIFIPSCPLHIFLWIQFHQIMKEWFSWVWPIAWIRVRQYFCRLCVSDVWLECFKCYWSRIADACWSLFTMR